MVSRVKDVTDGLPRACWRFCLNASTVTTTWELQAMDRDDLQSKCEILETVKPAWEALLQAFECATDTDSSVWDFAIPIQRLFDLGASETELRWLVRKELVEHGREVTVEGDDGRQFRPTGNLTFSDRTCFVLTKARISAAQLQCNHPNNEQVTAPSKNGDGCIISPLSTPHWDAELRKLHLNEQIVKRFKWPAPNQEAVLSAFHEEGWPERIDDPLRPQPEQDPKRRLADTIKCLNRSQVNQLIHFRGDGTGEGVVWERPDTNGKSDFA